MGHRPADQPQRAHQIEIDRIQPGLIIRKIIECPARRTTSVANQNVETSAHANRLVDQAVDILREPSGLRPPQARPGRFDPGSRDRSNRKVSASRPLIVTRAPSRASVIATALPNPLLDAATTATFPANPRSISNLRHPQTVNCHQTAYRTLVAPLPGPASSHRLADDPPPRRNLSSPTLHPWPNDPPDGAAVSPMMSPPRSRPPAPAVDLAWCCLRSLKHGNYRLSSRSCTGCSCRCLPPLPGNMGN